MKEAVFILKIVLDNPLLNVPIIIFIFVSLTIAVTLLVGVMVKLCSPRKLTVSQQALITRLCLIVAVILFTLLGLAGHSYFVSQRGIMLAAPKRPASFVLAHADEHLHLVISKGIEM